VKGEEGRMPPAFCTPEGLPRPPGRHRQNTEGKVIQAEGRAGIYTAS
jgi:hypothetical protein